MNGGLNLKDSWCSFEKGELFVRQMHISPYEKGNIFNRDPLRPKKLLLHRKELNRLYGLVKQQQGLYPYPTLIHFKGSRVRDRTGVCAAAKSCIISVPMPPSVMPSGISNAPCAAAVKPKSDMGVSVPDGTRTG